MCMLKKLQGCDYKQRWSSQIKTNRQNQGQVNVGGISELKGQLFLKKKLRCVHGKYVLQLLFFKSQILLSDKTKTCMYVGDI